MKIVFDLMHPAHINFFKHAIRILKAEGHEIRITALNRGKVPAIVQQEFPDIPVRIIGKHKGTAFSIIFQANVFRFFSMFFYLLKERPDLGFSVGSFILGSSLKILNRRNYQFDDDPERKMNVFLEKLTSTHLYFPAIYRDKSDKVSYFNCLKEWAYLSPSYLKPAVGELGKYGLEPGKYIFVREVSTGSLNYKDQKENTIGKFARELPADYKYLFSLEDKSNRSVYPADWILLQEPVKDIHSLIYFSACAISSGDSMAREAAMLGVPSIYCGIRKMRANEWMEKEGKLISVNTNVAEKVKELLCQKTAEGQTTFRENLQKKWDDVTLIILGLVKTSRHN